MRGFADGTMGAVNGMRPDGTVDHSSEQSAEVWVGTTYALAAFMIGRGLIEEGWATARGAAAVTYERGLWFRTPEAYDSDGNFRASLYLRPLAIWAIEEALERRGPDRDTRDPAPGSRRSTAERPVPDVGADPLHEPADPAKRLLEPLVGRRVAHPDVAGAGRPEGTPRDDRHVLLVEQPLGELVVGEAGRADPREGVERAARLERLETEGVEPVDDEAATPVVLGRIRSTSASPSTMATSAASWAIVPADMIPYWWTLTMPSRIAAGAAT